jgi:biotin transport system substrate-specific component
MAATSPSRRLLAYIAEGAAGLPVFTNGGGLAYFAGPTTGYLIGFVIAAGITGWAADRGYSRKPLCSRRQPFWHASDPRARCCVDRFPSGFGFEKAIAWGIGPFIVTDIIKAVLAAALVPALWSLFRRK